MQSVVAAGPGLVAVGNNGRDNPFDTSYGRVWTSPDGLIWTPLPYGDAYQVGPRWQPTNGVVAWGEGFLTVGGVDYKPAVWVYK